MTVDRYRTVAGEGHAQLREKASRFIAYAFPIRDEEDFRMRLDEIARKHHDSRHVCHAWVLGAAGERHRSYDAGEPAGTAGKPILIRIQGAGLTHCAVVVVRYFGGTLLGKAGLVKAFGEVAALALADAGTREEVVRRRIVVRCDYATLDKVRAQVLDADGIVEHVSYAELCTLRAALPEGSFQERLSAWRAQGLDVAALDQEQ